MGGQGRDGGKAKPLKVRSITLYPGTRATDRDTKTGPKEGEEGA